MITAGLAPAIVAQGKIFFKDGDYRTFLFFGFGFDQALY